MMKQTLSIIIGSMGALGAFAAETVLYQQNFDSDVVGRAPAGWAKVWGDQGKDSVLISGEKSASGDNSLLIDHQSESPMYGYGLSLSPTPLATGVLTVDFKIMLSAGSQLSFELREKNKRTSTARWGFGKSVFSASACSPNPKVWTKRIIDTRNDEWYTVKVEIPIGADRGDTVKYTITDGNGNTASSEFDYLRQDSPVQFLFFNLPATGNPSAKTYLDDLTVTLSE